MTDMSKKEQFDALMKLSDFRFARWKDRRVYEWKVFLALCAGMAGSAVVLKTAEITEALKYGNFCFWIALATAQLWYGWDTPFGYAGIGKKIRQT